MNTYITLACLLAVFGTCLGNPYGHGYGGHLVPAISSVNVYRAAPIPVIRTAAIAPIIAPAVSTVPILRTVNYGGYGLRSLGYGGYGYGGYGYGGYGYGGLGYGRLGYSGLGYGHGYGLGYGHGYGHGYGGKIYG